jgi:opacity protein-like surface antigen
MKNNYFKILTFITFLLFSINVFSQYTTKRVRDKYKEYTDSLKNVEYNYVFPILGQGAYKEGFDIPYPMGVMLNYFWLDQEILIDNLQLGYQNAYNLNNSFDLRPIVDENGEELLGFGTNTNVSYSMNIRPDLWLFPFLNLYGIFGYGQSHTEVNINRLGSKAFDLKSVVDQGVRTSGFGFLLAGGIGPFWITSDINFTWNKPELLDKSTFVNVVGIRMGKAFVFKKHPERNIALWTGAMWIKMQSETIGAVKMKDALPQEVWDNKDKTVANYRDWYDNEATTVQKIIADKTLTPIIDELENRNGESVIEYGIDKQVAAKWNMLLGTQYQHNKHWQLRFEAGILGKRTSFLMSLNYRFLGLKKK